MNFYDISNVFFSIMFVLLGILASITIIALSVWLILFITEIIRKQKNKWRSNNTIINASYCDDCVFRETCWYVDTEKE